MELLLTGVAARGVRVVARCLGGELAVRV
jgi:hypothetical protein